MKRTISKNNLKKMISILLVCMMLAMMLAGCGSTESSSDDSSGSAETTESTDDDTTADLESITVCLDWTPNTNHTGLYVALANGYYEEAGLDVEIVQPPENGSAMMCASGQAQFAVEAQDTLVAALIGDDALEVTAVAALLQHNTSGIISRAGEGMDTPSGLCGKTYSTWDSPIELAMIKYVVEQDGGNYDDITLIPNVITDEAAALAANQTDAIWIYYGWGGISAQLSGLDFDYFAFADLADVFDYYTPILIANNEFLEEEPETAKAFMEATRKGYEYAVENPEEAAQILIDGDTTGALDGSEELVTESQKWISEQYIADADEWGYIDPERWNNFYAWLYENDLIEEEIPEGTGFSNDYLQ